MSQPYNNMLAVPATPCGGFPIPFTMYEDSSLFESWFESRTNLLHSPEPTYLVDDINPVASSLQSTKWAITSRQSETNRQMSAFGVLGNPANIPTRVTDDLWESHRHAIWCLYIDENRTLGEVMEIMSRHGFHATTKMYKSRFTRWGFVKNNLRKDVERMMNIEEKRKAAGKESAFFRNGRPIRISKYLRRTKSLGNPKVNSSDSRSFPEYIRCRTPSPEPFLSESSHFQNSVLWHFSRLASHHLKLQSDPFDFDNLAYTSSEAKMAIEDITAGGILIGEGQLAGHKILRRGFSSIHCIFGQYPLYGFIELFFRSHFTCDERIKAVLWQYLYSYSKHVHSATHPLHQLLELLHKRYGGTISGSDCTIREVQIAILNQFQRLETGRDFVLLFVMSHGDLEILSSSSWAEFMSLNLHKMSLYIQEFAGLSETHHHDRLLYYIYQVAELYGWDSERAFDAASAVLKNIGVFNTDHQGLYFTCRHLQAEHHWSKWSQGADMMNPRYKLAISIMSERISYWESCSETNWVCVYSLQVLESWQKQVGLKDEADQTRLRFLHELQRIEGYPEPDV